MVFRLEVSVLLMLLALGPGSASLAAQPATTEPQPIQAGGPALPGTPRAGDGPAQPIPALPGTKTRADTFRELLAMTPDDLAKALAGRTEYNRKYLENSLREYQALSPDEREARLQQLDVTCHMDDLMRLEPDRRAERLANVPPALRPLIDERLRQWDLLPPRVQQSVREYETTANYFFRVRPPSSGQERRIPNPPAPVNALPSETPGRIMAHFTQFLDLPVKEQQKTLAALPQGEREEMEEALKTFSGMPPAQRKICIDSFEKFSRMSKAQRDQFLANAARWQAMSPQERETWRSLIRILPPPAPGLSRPPALPDGGPFASNRAGAIRTE